MSSSKQPEPPLEILEGMRHPVPMAEPPDAEAQRRLAIDGIANAIRHGGHRRMLRRRWLALGAAAVLVSVSGAYALRGPLAGRAQVGTSATLPTATGATVRVVSGTVVTSRGSRSTTVSAGAVASVSEGDEIASDAKGEATLLLPRGVRVTLAGSTRARIENAGEAEQRLRLELGRTEVSVPRPGGPRIFAIKTPDSDVIVHGTEFSVQVERQASSAVITTVSVTRGSVLVVHAGTQRFVETGATWSSEAERPPAPAVSLGSVAQDARASNPPRIATATETETKIAGRAPSPTPSLADQNRLFQAFLDARDEGNDTAAVRALDELLARFPDTPLADQARLARFRALQRLGGKRP
jgi:hypothetical protein